MTEHWRPIPGWEGQYSVSNKGRVRSEARIVHRKDGRSRRTVERILKPNPHPSGHLLVDLGTTQRSAKIHQLVLLAFVGPRPEGMETLHWDDNPANNHLSNLRYGTRSDNMQDALRNGTHPTGSKTHCINKHPFSPENTYVDPRTGSRSCRTCTRDRGRAKRLAAPKLRQPQTACRRAGHDWADPRNVYVYNGVRTCAECARIRSNTRYHALKAVAS